MYKWKTLINSFSVNQNEYLASSKCIRMFHSDQKLAKQGKTLLTYVDAYIWSLHRTFPNSPFHTAPQKNPNKICSNKTGILTIFCYKNKT